jgi:type IV pilus assembly protein PilN
MARINLLPWREQLRKEKQRDFLVLLGFAAVVTAILVAVAYIHVGGLIEYQERRNAFLQNEIRILDAKIKEIRSLEATKKALLERMRVIEDLQKRRPVIVHVFDELVNTLPPATYLTSVRQKGNMLEIAGRAESNARVSKYMRNIEASPWLRDPSLEVIERKNVGGMRVSEFRLRAKITTPDDEQSDEQLATAE